MALRKLATPSLSATLFALSLLATPSLHAAHEDEARLRDVDHEVTRLRREIERRFPTFGHTLLEAHDRLLALRPLFEHYLHFEVQDVWSVAWGEPVTIARLREHDGAARGWHSKRNRRRTDNRLETVKRQGVDPVIRRDPVLCRLGVRTFDALEAEVRDLEGRVRDLSDLGCSASDLRTLRRMLDRMETLESERVELRERIGEPGSAPASRAVFVRDAARIHTPPTPAGGPDCYRPETSSAWEAFASHVVYRMERAHPGGRVVESVAYRIDFDLPPERIHAGGTFRVSLRGEVCGMFPPAGSPEIQLDICGRGVRIARHRPLVLGPNHRTDSIVVDVTVEPAGDGIVELHFQPAGPVAAPVVSHADRAGDACGCMQPGCKACHPFGLR